MSNVRESTETYLGWVICPYFQAALKAEDDGDDLSPRVLWGALRTCQTLLGEALMNDEGGLSMRARCLRRAVANITLSEVPDNNSDSWEDEHTRPEKSALNYLKSFYEVMEEVMERNA